MQGRSTSCLNGGCAQAGLLAQKDSLTPCVLVGLQSAVNAAGSFALVAGLRLGLPGVAAATVAGQWLGAVLLLRALCATPVRPPPVQAGPRVAGVIQCLEARGAGSRSSPQMRQEDGGLLLLYERCLPGGPGAADVKGAERGGPAGPGAHVRPDDRAVRGEERMLHRAAGGGDVAAAHGGCGAPAGAPRLGCWCIHVAFQALAAGGLAAWAGHAPLC